VEDALWELCAAGRVTGDGFAGLRALIDKNRTREGAWRVGRMRGGAAPAVTGRWALLRSTSSSEDDPIEAAARQYLRRYGVVLRDLLAREAHAPPWRDLVRVYRRLEMRGEIRGGRMVASFVGEQFALPEALDALRAIRKEAKNGEVVRVSACDPLNLVGVITPGPRVPAHLGALVEYRDGVYGTGSGSARASGSERALPLPVP
jgi:ATP-dependent Lhr-like helicase